MSELIMTLLAGVEGMVLVLLLARWGRHRTKETNKRLASWTEDPKYPVRDWVYEVTNDDTRLGYADWVWHRREMFEEDGA